MGHWKANILTLILGFGTIGYLLMEQHIDVRAMWQLLGPLPEYGIMGETLELVIFIPFAFICVIGMTIYVFKWWIIIAILIIWLAMITSRRN